MKARIALTKPEDIEVTVAITMPLSRWKDLRTMVREHPMHTEAGRLAAVIRDLVDRAQASFEAEMESDGR